MARKRKPFQQKRRTPAPYRRGERVAYYLANELIEAIADVARARGNISRSELVSSILTAHPDIAAQMAMYQHGDQGPGSDQEGGAYAALFADQPDLWEADQGEAPDLSGPMGGDQGEAYDTPGPTYGAVAPLPDWSGAHGDQEQPDQREAPTNGGDQEHPDQGEEVGPMHAGALPDRPDGTPDQGERPGKATRDKPTLLPIPTDLQPTRRRKAIK